MLGIKITQAMIANLIAVVLWVQFAAAAIQGRCPPLGAVLPAPKHPSTCAAVQAAIYKFQNDFTSLTSEFSGSAVSVSVMSIHQPPAEKLIDLHYTPPIRDPASTNVVDANTIYRIGSISKIFTILGVLLEGIGMDEPVRQYLSGLKPGRGWDNITIGALASHMSGIGLDLMDDLADTPGDWTTMGFPALNGNESSPGCSGMYGLPTCSTDELYRDFIKHRQVYGTFTTPMYSNLGFDILGLVLKNVTGLTYADYIENAILTPLNLANTTTGSTLSVLPRAFIPSQSADQSHWGVEHGYDNPAGGFLSTTNDLLALGSAILHPSLLGSTMASKWLKPVSSTSTFGRAMGAPWEILQSTNLTSDGRLIELYTKGGDDGSYHSKLCLIPDYGLVVTILTAGPEADFTFSFSLLSQLLSTLLPAIEQAGKEEATLGFAGTYTNATTNSGLTLHVDDGPGLEILNWTVRGRDVVSIYANISGLSDVSVMPRLYPTNLGVDDATSTWRAVFDTGTAEEKAEFDAKFAWPGQSCQTWANMDRFQYGFNSIDEFVFTTDEQSGNLNATSLWNTGFQVSMTRQF